LVLMKASACRGGVEFAEEVLEPFERGMIRGADRQIAAHPLETAARGVAMLRRRLQYLQCVLNGPFDDVVDLVHNASRYKMFYSRSADRNLGAAFVRRFVAYFVTTPRRACGVPSLLSAQVRCLPQFGTSAGYASVRWV
jgi:hypothetical protein